MTPQLVPAKRKLDSPIQEVKLEQPTAGLQETPSDAVQTGRFPIHFRPTRMCHHMLFGRCQRGSDCTFAHDESELHPNARAGLPPAPPPVPATWAAAPTWQEPRYPKPSDSVSLHGPRELEGPGMTELCTMWLQHPSYCLKGDGCVYAHGLAEAAAAGVPDVVIRVGRGATSTFTVEPRPAPGTPMTPAPMTPVPGAATKVTRAIPAPPPVPMHKLQQIEKGGSARGRERSRPPANDRGRPGAERPARICEFWKRWGSCRKGNACDFLHTPREPVEQRAPPAVAYEVPAPPVYREPAPPGSREPRGEQPAAPAAAYPVPAPPIYQEPSAWNPREPADERPLAPAETAPPVYQEHDLPSPQEQRAQEPAALAEAYREAPPPAYQEPTEEEEDDDDDVPMQQPTQTSCQEPALRCPEKQTDEEERVPLQPAPTVCQEPAPPAYQEPAPPAQLEPTKEV